MVVVEVAAIRPRHGQSCVRNSGPGPMGGMGKGMGPPMGGKGRGDGSSLGDWRQDRFAGISLLLNWE